MQNKDDKRFFASVARKYLTFLIITVFIAGLMTSLSFGQNNEIDIITGVRVIQYSKILNEDRTLLISYPTPDKNKLYPVLYLLDGKTNIKIVSGIIDYLSTCKIIPEMIIVGIANTERIRDMTPSKNARFANSGGADNFHKFITTELIPYIEDNYPASSEKILVGHSLGGLFSLFSLLQAPETFNSYVAISPSIQYNDFEYPPIIKNFFLNRKGLQGVLFLSFADEGQGGAFRRLNKLYQDILPNKGDDFNIYCRQYPDNNHITTLIPAVSDALITYFKNK